MTVDPIKHMLYTPIMNTKYIKSGQEVRKGIEAMRREQRAEDFNNSVAGSILALLGCGAVAVLIVIIAIMVMPADQWAVTLSALQ